MRKGATCSFLDLQSSLIIISASQLKTPHQQRHPEAKDGSDSDIIPTIASSATSERTDDRSISLSEVLGGSHFTTAERDNLRLMSHYASYACMAIAGPTSITREVLFLWRDYVPQLAFEHDYLLHGLLGLSSLHLALSQPSLPHEHAVLATHHHNVGIAVFRAQLTNITANNINALFAFSCILVLYSFGIYRSVESQLDPIAKIHEVLTLVRGTGVIVRSGCHWLQQGPMSAALMPQAADSTRELSVEMEGVLTELSRRIHTTVATTVHGDVYAAAISTLRHNFVLATERPDAILAIVLFPIMVRPEFLVLVCIGEPLALAILANYAVILHWLRGHIWLEGWGKQVIDAVHQALPQNWHECIAWAVLEARSG